MSSDNMNEGSSQGNRNIEGTEAESETIKDNDSGLQITKRSEGLAWSEKHEKQDKNILELKDIRQVLPRNPDKLLPLDGEFNPEDAKKVLLRKHLIVLSCHYEEVLNTAFELLIKQPDIKHYTQRVLDPDDQQYSEYDNMAAQLLQPIPSLDGGKTVIIIPISHGDRGEEIYNSLLGNAQVIEDASQRLKELKRMLVFLITPSPNMFHMESLSDQYFDIDYVRPMLKQEIWERVRQEKPNSIDQMLEQTVEERSKPLLKTLETVRQSGYWSSDEVFRHFFISCYNDRTLEKRIEEINHNSDGLSSQALEGFCQTFNNGRINQILFYVAIFFISNSNMRLGLGLNEFSRVVSALLRGEKIKLTKKGQVIDPLEQREEKDSDRVVVLSEYWLNKRDELLRENGLVVVSLEDRTTFVSFNIFSLRFKLSDYMQKHHAFFMEEAFEKVREQGLLFDESVQIGEAVINLVVIMIAWNPSYYDEQWFFELMVSFVAVNNKFPSLTSVQEKMPREYFQTLNGGMRQFVLGRIANLLKELRSRTQSEQFVNRLLEHLIRNGMFEITLGIVDRMRNVNGFDSLYWIKQVINRGDNIARNNAFSLLRNQLLNSGGWMGDLLEILLSWMPEAGKSPKHYSRANEMAVSLLLVVLLDSTLEFDIRNYGQWPTGHRVLAQLLSGQNLEKQLLCRIITHPKLMEVLVETASIEDLTALLKGKWQLALRGIDHAVATDQLIQNMFTHLTSQVVQQLQSPDADIGYILLQAARTSKEKFREEAKEIVPVLIAEWHLIVNGLDVETSSSVAEDAFKKFLTDLTIACQDKKTGKAIDRSLLNMTNLIREAVEHVKVTEMSNRRRNLIIKPLLKKRARVNELRKEFTRIQKMYSVAGD